MKTFKEIREKIPTGIVVHKELIPTAIIYHSHTDRPVLETTLAQAEPIHQELSDSSDFNDKEKEEIKNYGRSSFGLNATLIGRHHFNEPVTEKIHDHHIPTLDKITNKPIGRKLTVFSGLGFDPTKRMDSKGRVFLPSYTSSSLTKETADYFAGMQKKAGERFKHVLKLHLNPENRGAYTAPHTGTSFEREMLLPRNSTIHITHSEQDPNDPKQMIHHATISHDTHPDEAERNPEALTSLPDVFHHHYTTKKDSLTPENRQTYINLHKKEKARKAANMTSITDILNSLK